MLLGEDHEPAALTIVDEPEALIREARHRARLRRARVLGVVLGLVGVAVAAWLVPSRSGGVVVSENASRPFANVSRFSGNGKLAFVSRGRLWVLDGDVGMLRPVSRAGDLAADPEFSPDGHWLSYRVTSSASGVAALWVAGADGSSPHRVDVAAGIADDWLPNGDLVGGHAIWRLGRHGSARRVGAAPVDLLAWSPQGGRYVFVRWARMATQRGVLDVSVARSLTGPRSIWLRTRSTSARSGSNGRPLFIIDAFVLPGRAGIVLRTQDYCCDWADGFSVERLRAAGAKLVTLGSNVDSVLSVARDGEFAFTDGLNRYAWITKRATICSPSSERCAAVPTPAGMLSLDPSLSPNGRMIAYVQAQRGWAGNIGQASVHAWYATHSLWLLRSRGGAPVEVPDSRGASTPVWSTDGHSLMYVSGDALWLLRSTSGRPVRIVAPLFSPSNWDSFFGEIDWTSQFAWSHA